MTQDQVVRITVQDDASAKLDKIDKAQRAAGDSAAYYEERVRRSQPTFEQVERRLDRTIRLRDAESAAERRAVQAIAAVTRARDEGNITEDRAAALIAEASAAREREIAAARRRLGILTQETAAVDRAAAALQGQFRAMDAVTSRAAGLEAATNRAAGGFRNVGQVAASAGLQLQDVVVQAQAGTNAMTILAQQGSQFLGIFGPAGAIAGAGLAISAVAVQLLTAGDAAEKAAERALQLQARKEELERRTRSLDDVLGDEASTVADIIDATRRAADSTDLLSAANERLDSLLLTSQELRKREIEDRRAAAAASTEAAIAIEAETAALRQRSLEFSRSTFDRLNRQLRTTGELTDADRLELAQAQSILLTFPRAIAESEARVQDLVERYAELFNPPKGSVLAEELKRLTEDTSKLTGELKAAVEEYNKLAGEDSETSVAAQFGLFGPDFLADLEKRNKLLDEGRRITEQYRTPAEEFADTQERLNVLLAAGAVSVETYTRALLDADPATAALKQQQDKINGQAEDFGSLFAESAEHFPDDAGDFNAAITEALQ